MLNRSQVPNNFSLFSNTEESSLFSNTNKPIFNGNWYLYPQYNLFPSQSDNYKKDINNKNAKVGSIKILKRSDKQTQEENITKETKTYKDVVLCEQRKKDSVDDLYLKYVMKNKNQDILGYDTDFIMYLLDRIVSGNVNISYLDNNKKITNIDKYQPKVKPIKKKPMVYIPNENIEKELMKFTNIYKKSFNNS
jgi:hypothetical protein